MKSISGNEENINVNEERKQYGEESIENGNNDMKSMAAKNQQNK
jgi:hypothetical protein